MFRSAWSARTVLGCRFMFSCCGSSEPSPRAPPLPPPPPRDSMWKDTHFDAGLTTEHSGFVPPPPSDHFLDALVFDSLEGDDADCDAALVRRRRAAALRRRVEKEIARPLPAVLSDQWLLCLLDRVDRDEDWACAKAREVVRWRDEFDAVSLLEEESMAEAGRVLKEGSLYWHGVDAEGNPVLWSRSGFVDIRDHPPEAWIRAFATILEVGASSGAPRFTYIECTHGLQVSRFPIRRGFQIVRGALDVLLRGFPERGSTFVVAPTTTVNRALLTLARPFLPDSVRRRLFLLPDEAAAQRALCGAPGSSLNLGVPVPTFFGGSVEHDVPRASDGSLDIAAMARSLRIQVEQFQGRHQQQPRF